MLFPLEDGPKRRLTEPLELKRAAEFLIARGFECDEIAVQLSRFYYVDIDVLNDALVGIASAQAPVEPWRSLARN